MKKIPTLFKRMYFEDGSFLLTQEVTEGMEWVLCAVHDRADHSDDSRRNT